MTIDEVPEPLPPFPGAPRRRQRAVKAPLSTERIVDAAFAIMAREGFEAVTMRRLAQDLGTGPASLYAHVSNKRELDSMIIDRVAAEVVVPEPDPAHWQEQIMQAMRDLLAAMRRHPGVARAVIANVPTGGEALMTTERLMGLMLAAGVEVQVAAWSCDLLPLFVTAVAYEESIYQQVAATTGPDDEDEFIAELRTYFQALPAARFPNLAASALALTTGTGDDRFEFGLHVLMSGIAAVSDRWAEHPLEARVPVSRENPVEPERPSTYS